MNNRTGWHVGYKVLLNHNKELYSCSKFWYVCKAIRYRKYKSVKPSVGCGPMCVFDSLIKAQAFVAEWLRLDSKRASKWEVYNCIYKESKKESKAESLWAGYGRLPIDELPEGTRLADEVIITGESNNMLKTWHKGYKVLKQRNKQLESATAALPTGGLDRVRYMVGKAIKPHVKCGPLYIFKSLKKAENFANKGNNIIYECLYKPSKEKFGWFIYNNIYRYGRKVKKGSCLADEVIITKRVRRGTC